MNMCTQPDKYDGWQARVREELEDLQVRAAKLEAFTDTPEYDGLGEAQRAYLLMQSYGMALYADALKLRLGRCL